VDRQSVLGNPYTQYNCGDRDAVCDKYADHFKDIVSGARPNVGYHFMEELNRLLKIYKKYGQLYLFCWCAPKRCHAETIKKWLESQ